MLTPKEKYRYDRQIKLDSFRIDGQEKLKKSAVLVIGAGGLGCPILQYLASSGIGKIGIVDFDSINETNFPRQILFHQSDLGNNKAFAARERIQQINPDVSCEAYPKIFDAELAFQITSNYDLIIDATDNFSTRYLINDVCVFFGKPFVFGSVYKTEGQVSVFNYKNGPTYRCLFPDPPMINFSCNQVGVHTALCGITALKQVNEAIKILSETGAILSGKLEIYDAFNLTTSLFSFERKIHEKLSESEIRAFDYPSFCNENDNRFLIDATELKKLMIEEAVQILDIRQDWEEPKLTYTHLFQIPLQEIESALNRLDQQKKIVVVCQYGTRSGIAVDFLTIKNRLQNVVHLQGGVKSMGLE